MFADSLVNQSLTDKTSTEKDLDRLDKWIKEEVPYGRYRTWQKESMTAVRGRDWQRREQLCSDLALEDLLDRKFIMTQKCALVAKKDKIILESTNRSTVS